MKCIVCRKKLTGIQRKFCSNGCKFKDRNKRRRASGEQSYLAARKRAPEMPSSTLESIVSGTVHNKKPVNKKGREGIIRAYREELDRRNNG